jgi:hypothetical protein
VRKGVSMKPRRNARPRRLQAPLSNPSHCRGLVTAELCSDAETVTQISAVTVTQISAVTVTQISAVTALQ